ncbi:transcriptional regulator [bacterium]|nr:transcriptional regulator [bacterium]
MARFERLNELLRILRDTPGVNVQELAERFGADRRTIQRDLQDLRACGHDIQEIPGPIRHYYLSRPERPESLRSFSWFFEADFLDRLGEALLQRRRLRIYYRGSQSLRADWLEVEPRQLFFEGHWQLRAFCPPAQKFRVFRLDRIQEWEVLALGFAPSPMEEPLPWHHWDRQGGPAIEVECQVSQSLALRLREEPVHPSQRLQGNKLWLRVSDYDALLDWMLSQNYCRVLEPDWLLQRFQERVRLLRL